MRGLHYDIEKGILLKLDSFLQIQFGSVYKGLRPLSNEKVLEIYKNRIIPIAYVEGQTKYAYVSISNNNLGIKNTNNIRYIVKLKINNTIYKQ